MALDRWQIQIGVDTAGELLIGAQAVAKARAEDRLCAFETIYPSQMKHRAAVLYREIENDPDCGIVCDSRQQWGIMRIVRARRALAIGTISELRPFPKADPAYSRRRGV